MLGYSVESCGLGVRKFEVFNKFILGKWLRPWKESMGDIQQFVHWYSCLAVWGGLRKVLRGCGINFLRELKRWVMGKMGVLV